MDEYKIENTSDFFQLQKYIQENSNEIKILLKNGNYQITVSDEQFIIPMSSFEKQYRDEIYTWIKQLDKPKVSNEDSLIFGKDITRNIVSCEVSDSNIELFLEKEGQISSKFIPNKYWLLSNRAFNDSWEKLEGNLHYKYIKYYNTREEFYRDKSIYKNADTFSIHNPKEAAMVLYGFTYFKGMKVSDVSCLFFDIESTGLTHNNDAKVLLISNTYVNQGNVTRKLFAYDEYNTEAEMFDAWCTWVKELNPSVIAGHNIFSYDLPYLNFCAKKAGTSLNLGRDASELRFEKYVSKFRKDGSQDYEYNRAYIYGREIVDTMFVAYHFDIGRKYESYALKQIIKQEGLEVKDRQFYDASKIWETYKDPEEWIKIKQYAIHDADDAMALYNLMIPSYFYLTSYIPKSFQDINYTAPGSQINVFLIRSYLQHGHSLPESSPYEKYAGALSDGFPGIYSNVFKIDIASLYPSIILQYEVYNKEKDPKAHFLKMVKYFTEQRLKDKQKAKETGDRYYKELEQSRKVVINSCYGVLGAQGLLFNSCKHADFVTAKGREILKQSILWATGQEYIEKEKNEES